MADPVGLLVFGLDHHRTPVAVRERLAVGAERLPLIVNGLRERLGVDEAVVLSTCNRLECYLVGQAAIDRLASTIGELHGIDQATLRTHAYLHQGRAAARHLFRVASGLESLVLGEEQIVGQVKQAYESSHAAGGTGTTLNPLFQRALGVAKEVRTTTALSRHKLSVSSIAVDLARQIQGDLANARLLVLGAGEMAELTVRYLVEHGVRTIGIVNRNQERAMGLAELANAKVYGWSDLRTALADHDVVVSSTGAPHLVVHPEDVRAAMAKRRRALVLIDLAVPRDIDPDCGELDDVFVYNIDHLESVVAANRQLRSEEVGAAEALVDAQVAAYLSLSQPGTTTLLADVARFFDDVVASEADRLAERLAISDPAQRKELRYGVERATNKLTHRIHAWLRANPGDPQSEQVIRELLGLPPSSRS